MRCKIFSMVHPSSLTEGLAFHFFGTRLSQCRLSSSKLNPKSSLLIDITKWFNKRLFFALGIKKIHSFKNVNSRKRVIFTLAFSLIFIDSKSKGAPEVVVGDIVD